MITIPALIREDQTIEVIGQPVLGLDPNHDPIDAYMACRTIPGGVQKEIQTNAVIGVSTSITVPAGKKWTNLSLQTDLTCTATVGNRTVLVRLFGLTGVPLWTGSLGAATAAAQVAGYDIGFGGALATPSTAVRRVLTFAAAANTNTQVREVCPVNVLGPGQYISIKDLAAIDNADVLQVCLMYTESDA